MSQADHNESGSVVADAPLPEAHPSEPTRTADKVEPAYALLWLGLLALCCVLWETEKGILSIALVVVTGVPILAIFTLIALASGALSRRWRYCLSVLSAPIFASGLFLLIVGDVIDLEKIHFYLVKYPHEVELLMLPPSKRNFHQWDWGLDALSILPGVGYSLVYDASDAVMQRQTPGPDHDALVRPMGDHFYVDIETEDRGPVCKEMSDWGY